MRHEVHYLYRLMLKERSKVIDLVKYIEYYEMYNRLIIKISKDQTYNVPLCIRARINYALREIPKPKYLDWINKYLKRKR